MYSVTRIALGYRRVRIVINTFWWILFDDFYIGNREDALFVGSWYFTFIPVLINSLKKNYSVSLKCIMEMSYQHIHWKLILYITSIILTHNSIFPTVLFPSLEHHLHFVIFLPLKIAIYKTTIPVKWGVRHGLKMLFFYLRGIWWSSLLLLGRLTLTLFFGT